MIYYWPSQLVFVEIIKSQYFEHTLFMVDLCVIQYCCKDIHNPSPSLASNRQTINSHKDLILVHGFFIIKFFTCKEHIILVATLTSSSWLNVECKGTWS
jgi:hypothetical protein